MFLRIRTAFLIGAATVLPLAACRPVVRTLPEQLPAHAGTVTSQSFALDRSTPGHLFQFGVRQARGSVTSYQVPQGYFRVDSATTWVVAHNGRLDWDKAGVPDMMGAKVRVWLRGEPTSVTATEMWGKAALIVVDSLGR